MTRSGALVCVATYGLVTGCGGSPSAPTPTGTPLFAEGRVSMTFTPQDQTFAEAAEAYRRTWVAEGSAILEAMERVSGLTFLEQAYWPRGVNCRLTALAMEPTLVS